MGDKKLSYTVCFSCREINFDAGIDGVWEKKNIEKCEKCLLEMWGNTVAI